MITQTSFNLTDLDDNKGYNGWANWTTWNCALWIGGDQGFYNEAKFAVDYICLLYTSPSPRDLSTSRMPSSA